METIWGSASIRGLFLGILENKEVRSKHHGHPG